MLFFVLYCSWCTEERYGIKFFALFFTFKISSVFEAIWNFPFKSYFLPANGQAQPDFRSMLKKTWAHTGDKFTWRQKLKHILIIFTVLSSQERSNSHRKKREKLILSSGSCSSVHPRRTMKKSAWSLELPTFAGCWRDSIRWKRRGRKSRRR